MAAIANLYIDAGSTFSAIISCKGSDGLPLDLTGYTVAAQIRKSYASATAYSLNPTIYSATAGKIRIALSHTQSSAIKAGRYMYDIEITSGSGERKRVSEGIVIVTPEITKV